MRCRNLPGRLRRWRPAGATAVAKQLSGDNSPLSGRCEFQALEFSLAASEHAAHCRCPARFLAIRLRYLALLVALGTCRQPHRQYRAHHSPRYAGERRVVVVTATTAGGG